jgi:hypothetical protein
MVIRQALVKVDNPAGPVYSGVVMFEPWEAKDNSLMFTEVSYLQSCSFPVIGGLQKCVDVKFYSTSSVLCAVNVLYGDWGFQSMKLGLNACGIHVINE